MSLLLRRRALMSLKKGILPQSYKQVEYIESTGTQYIDTGYKANQDTSVEAKVFSSSITNQSFFSSRTGLYQETFSVFIANNAVRHDYYTSQVLTTLTPAINMLYEIYANKNILTVNNVTHTLNYAKFTADMNMLLGASSEPNSTLIKNFLIGKMYFYKIWDGDELVRDFIPCYRKSDKVAGLYDLVEGKFYENEGTGEFLRGGEV